MGQPSNIAPERPAGYFASPRKAICWYISAVGLAAAQRER